MKKILYALAQYPEKTGSGIYLQNLLREGSKKNLNQAVLYAKNLEDQVKLDIDMDNENEFVVNFNTPELDFNVAGMSDVMPYKSEKYTSLTNNQIEMWKDGFRKQIVKALENFKPEVIVSNHIWLLTSLILEIVGELSIKNIKVYTICHGTDIVQYNKDSRYRKYIKKHIREIDGIFALSNQQKKTISKIYSIKDEKIHVIGGGYRSDLFFQSKKETREAKDDKIKLIYAGKLSFAKGTDFLLDIYEDIPEKNVELILIGDTIGKEREHLVQRAKEISLKNEIILTGFVSQEKLAELFRNGDIFVMPSKYEGLSLVTIEALASGMRVVSTNLPSLKSNLGTKINNSGIIEYVDVVDSKTGHEDFKKAILKQIDNIKRNREIDKSVYDEIMGKSWEHIFEKMESFFI